MPKPPSNVLPKANTAESVASSPWLARFPTQVLPTTTTEALFLAWSPCTSPETWISGLNIEIRQSSTHTGPWLSCRSSATAGATIVFGSVNSRRRVTDWSGARSRTRIRAPPGGGKSATMGKAPGSPAIVSDLPSTSKRS